MDDEKKSKIDPNMVKFKAILEPEMLKAVVATCNWLAHDDKLTLSFEFACQFNAKKYGVDYDELLRLVRTSAKTETGDDDYFYILPKEEGWDYRIGRRRERRGRR